MNTARPDNVQGLEDRIHRLSMASRKRLAEWLEAQGPAPAASLVGYYKTSGASALSTADVRSFVSDRLPAHMVPNVFVQVEAMPRTPHGKLDREALAAPSAVQSTPAAVPTSELALAVVDIWRELLGMDRIDPSDSFFEIGGDSLLGIRLLGQIRDRWQIDLPMQALFDHPTAAETASHIEAVLWARESAQTEEDGNPGERDEVEF